MNQDDPEEQGPETCPLCDGAPRQTIQEDDHERLEVACDVCGKYRITEEARQSLGFVTADVKRRLSSVVRRHVELTGRAELITTDNYETLASSAPDNNDVPAKIRYLLSHIARKSQFPGDRIGLDAHTDYPVCFADNADEFSFYAEHVKEADFVDGEMLGKDRRYEYWLTPKGWQEIERLPRSILQMPSLQCLSRRPVAMRPF